MIAEAYIIEVKNKIVTLAVKHSWGDISFTDYLRQFKKKVRASLKPCVIVIIEGNNKYRLPRPRYWTAKELKEVEAQAEELTKLIKRISE